MILAWMVYAVIVGVIAFGTTTVVARAVRTRGRGERWIWAAGLAAALLLPLALPKLAEVALRPSFGANAEAGEAASIDLGRIVSAPVAAAARTGGDDLVLLLWISFSSLMAGRIVAGWARLRRVQRGSWPLRHSAHRVLVTRSVGPGVIGLIRPRILIPEWALGLPQRGRNWVLRHEIEHVRGRDPVLQYLVLLSRIVTPWNPAVWGLSGGLRRALETDCDRRVLQGRSDPRSYAETLIAVARRGCQPRLVLGAFDIRVANLHHRILSMTTNHLPLGAGRLALVSLLAAGSFAVACTVDSPATPDDPPVAEAEAAHLDGQPAFTPFTVGPDIVNREEVVAALEARYPPDLRDAGIGGTVGVWLYLDEEGIPQDTRIDEPSGNVELDRAALEVARTMRFTPAKNDGEPVPVWISLPVTFAVR